jgi:hypothetical protein
VKAKLVWKAASAASTLALLLGSMTPLAVAGVDGEASNDTTGAGSYNKSKIEVVQSTLVVQDNQADIDNLVELQLNTGGNKANKNTGAGDVTTGDASLGVAISNQANSNVAEVSDCGGCDMDLSASNEKTGADSGNKAKVEVNQITTLFQDNLSDIDNIVGAQLNTGYNKANKNTGEGSVDTGDIGATVVVENATNENWAVLGGGMGGDGLSLSAGNDTTGADSYNKAKVEAFLDTLITQSNEADVDNLVELQANTGFNKANKNTGEGDVETGDINVGVGLSNLLNSNFAAFDGCCDVEFDTSNEKTGADSTNKAKAYFFSLFDIFQTNGGEGGVTNIVGGKLDTGHNKTNKNTADANESGDIEAVVQVSTEANENIIGDLWEMPDMDWDIELPEPGDSMAWWMFFWGIFA